MMGYNLMKQFVNFVISLFWVVPIRCCQNPGHKTGRNFFSLQTFVEKTEELTFRVTLDVLNAESFCERVLSCVKLVVSDSHVSMKVEEILHGGVESLDDDEDDE
jgi:hypothetical protein